MKISAAQADIAGALASLSRVIEKRGTIPILQNVRLAADAIVGGGRLTLTGTDLDLVITVAVPATVEAPGVTTVPAGSLTDYVRRLPKGAAVTIDATERTGAAAVRAGRSRLTLPTISAIDFPDLAGLGEQVASFTLPAKALAGLLAPIEFAQSTEETRYYLNGTYLHRTTDAAGAAVLRAVATDGHRLGLVDHPCPDEAVGMPGAIVGRKAVGELIRLAEAAGDTDLAVEVTPHKIAIEWGAIRLVSKLVDGSFPDYMRVIPFANPVKALCEAGPLAAAIDRVSTVAIERGRAITLDFGEAGIGLAMRNPDAGDAAEDVDGRLDGTPVRIGCNARYAADILRALDAETVEIALDTPGSPMIWRAPARPERFFVLMPMRV